METPKSDCTQFRIPSSVTGALRRINSLIARSTRFAVAALFFSQSGCSQLGSLLPRIPSLPSDSYLLALIRPRSLDQSHLFKQQLTVLNHPFHLTLFGGRSRARPWRLAPPRLR